MEILTYLHILFMQTTMYDSPPKRFEQSESLTHVVCFSAAKKKRKEKKRN